MNAWRSAQRWVDRAVVVSAILLLWEAVGAYSGNRFLGQPSAVGAELLSLVGSGEVLPHLSTTLYEAISGFALGGIAGLVVGVVFGLSPYVAKVTEPFVLAMYSIPKITLVPILVLFFGIHEGSKIALVTIVTFFFVLFDTWRGMLAVSGDLKEVVGVMGAGRWQMFRYVSWPTAIEWVIDGLRISVPYMFVSAVAGEVVVSSQGLGYLIRTSAQQLNVNGMFAVMIVLMLLAVAVDSAIARASRHTSRWRQPFNSL